VGPLGAQPILAKPNLEVTYPGTRLSLLESHAWRCVTRVHACSKHIAQVGGFIKIHSLYMHILIDLLHCTVQILFNLFTLQVKNKPHHDMK
jgi:hypothetical protein